MGGPGVHAWGHRHWRAVGAREHPNSCSRTREGLARPACRCCCPALGWSDSASQDGSRVPAGPRVAVGAPPHARGLAVSSVSFFGPCPASSFTLIKRGLCLCAPARMWGRAVSIAHAVDGCFAWSCSKLFRLARPGHGWAHGRSLCALLFRWLDTGRGSRETAWFVNCAPGPSLGLAGRVCLGLLFSLCVMRRVSRLVAFLSFPWVGCILF